MIEVLYKLNREYRKKNTPEILERYSLILPTVLTSDTITIIHSFLNPTTTQIALKLRRQGHIDLMDCIIGATAAHLKGILVTEDLDYKKYLKQVDETKNITIKTWKEFQKFLYNKS